MKAKYLLHTQSHRKGDVIDFNKESMIHNQLLRNGVIAMIEPVKEAKVIGPAETKPASKKATK